MILAEALFKKPDQSNPCCPTAPALVLPCPECGPALARPGGRQYLSFPSAAAGAGMWEDVPEHSTSPEGAARGQGKDTPACSPLKFPAPVATGCSGALPEGAGGC